MMNLSLEQVKKFGSEIQSLRTKHEKAIEKANDVIEQGRGCHARERDRVRARRVWQTRSDHQKVLGVPVDLAMAHGARGRVHGDGRGRRRPAPALGGNGALSAHFHTVGRGVGKEMREKAGLPPVSMGGGRRGSSGGGIEPLRRRAAGDGAAAAR